MKYTTEQLTITRLIRKSQQELKRQLLPATTLGGNDTGAGKLTGRLTGQWSIQLYSSKHLHLTASKIGKGKVGQLHHLQDWHTLPKRNILSVQQVTITVSKLHFRTHTSSQSEIFSKTPERLYYQPQEDQETFTINAEGHLQCNQDSNKVIKATTPQDLPGSREYPIYHKPGSITINSVEDLIKLYPNSFDRLGSLKGAYDIKVDPTVPPVQHVRRKVPIESKQAIEEAIDYMVSQDILEQQIKPTPWVSSVTYPVKPSGEVRPCLDARDLNKAIIRENHKPQTVEEIAHQLAGATVFTKADALKAFLQVPPDRRKLQVAHDQHTQGKIQIQENALWSQNVTRCVPDENGHHHGEVPQA